MSEFVTGYVQELDDFIARYTDDFASRRKYAFKTESRFFAEVFAIFDRIAKGFAELKKIVLQAKTASTELKAKVKDFDPQERS